MVLELPSDPGEFVLRERGVASPSRPKRNSAKRPQLNSIPDQQKARNYADNSSSTAFAALRSAVSKPSVNQL